MSDTKWGMSIGDRVRLTKTPGLSLWTGITGVIKSFGLDMVEIIVDPGQYYTDGEPCRTRTLGYTFYPASLEVFEPRPKTDEELVEEINTLRTRIRELRKEIAGRGFKEQWRSPSRNVHDWRPSTPVPGVADESRYIKIETYKVMEEVTKTRTIEL